MMRIKLLKDAIDAGQFRKKGDVIEVSDEQGRSLIRTDPKDEVNGDPAAEETTDDLTSDVESKKAAEESKERRDRKAKEKAADDRRAADEAKDKAEQSEKNARDQKSPAQGDGHTPMVATASSAVPATGTTGNAPTPTPGTKG